MSLISIIIPVFNEEDNLQVLYQKLKNISETSEHDFEFIFVDDGSSDKSFNLLQSFSNKDNRVRVLSFSRNFGSHAGCLAGLIHAQGDASAFISADMQEPPELILRLIEQWEKGHEVVFGAREGGEDYTRFFPKLYYFLVRKLALNNMPQRGTDVFLISRKVVQTIINTKEKNTSIFGLILWSGFNQTFVPYKRSVRQKGVTRWSLGKKIKLFIDTFVSFSYFPVRLISYTGFLLSCTGFLYTLVVIAGSLFFFKVVEGWIYVIGVLILLSGIQLLMLGICGEYVWRSFDESRDRPVFIIDKMIGFGEDKLI